MVTLYNISLLGNFNIIHHWDCMPPLRRVCFPVIPSILGYVVPRQSHTQLQGVGRGGGRPERNTCACFPQCDIDHVHGGEGRAKTLIFTSIEFHKGLSGCAATSDPPEHGWLQSKAHQLEITLSCTTYGSASCQNDCLLWAVCRARHQCRIHAYSPHKRWHIIHNISS